MARLTLLLLTLLLLCDSIAAHTSYQATISLKGETFVEKPQVYLGKIADIRGNAAITERLSKISLGRSPKVGMLRTITLRRVRLVIAAAGFELSEIRIQMPRNVFVRRRGMKIDQRELEESVRSAIQKKYGISSEILISELTVPEVGQVPKGEAEFLTDFKGIRNPFEPFSLPISILVNGKLVRKLSARVGLDAFGEVYVAKQEVGQNSLVDESLVERRKIRLEKPISYYLTEEEELKGIKSARLLSAGDPLTKSSIVKAIVIRNGDNVRIRAVSKTFTLSASGVALGPGRIGERIAVKNEESGKIFKALILDKGLVQVNF